MTLQISKFDREKRRQMVKAFLPDHEVWKPVTVVITEPRPKLRLTFI